VNNRKRICFACITTCNLFVAYILSKTVYKKDYKILILSDFIKEDVYSKILKECSVWDEVILIREANRFPGKCFKDIRLQLKNIDFSNIDILHYFSFPRNSYSFILFDYILEKTQIIMTVYSMATYYIKEYYLSFKRMERYLNVDLDRISEIWIYDKRLYIGKLLERPVKNIEIIKYIENEKLLKEFCYELNKIFNYTHESMDYNVIFLDQPLAEKYIDSNKERQLFSRILEELRNNKVLIKYHPRSSIRKYKDFKVNIIKENNVPWEVILLNELNSKNLNNKIFISYFSDTLTTTHIFLNNLNIPHKVIWLKDIFQDCINIPIGLEGDSMSKIFIENFKKIYGKNFYDIKSIDELRKVLKGFK